MIEISRRESAVKLNPDLMKELNVIYLEYTERKGFPDAYCIEVSKDIARLGLLYREGHFKLDYPNKNELRPTHAWCEDSEKTIVDLTAHQFNAYLKEPLLRGMQVIRPKDPLYQRYTPLNTR